jgi:hypothetical protein
MVPPRTIEELIRSTTLIAIGTVDEYLGSGYTIPDEVMPTRWPGRPTEVWPFYREYLSTFSVKVEEVLYDNQGEFAAWGGPLVVDTSMGPPYPEVSLTPDGYVRVGDRYLLFLYTAFESMTDNLTYFWFFDTTDRLVIDGPYPTDGRGSAVPLAQGMTTEEFLAAVRAAIVELGDPTRIPR